VSVNFIRVIKTLRETLIASSVIARFFLKNVPVLIKCSLTNMGTPEKIAQIAHYHMMGLNNPGSSYKGGYLLHPIGTRIRRGTLR
jgi:hypothetical protein